MFQFAHNHYIPVFKWKEGEQKALASLPAEVKDRFTPLIELVAVPTNINTDEPVRTIEEQVEISVTALAKALGPGTPFFLDAGAIADETTTTGLSGPRKVFDDARGADLGFIPVVGLQRSSVEIEAAMAHHDQGLCIRLIPEDLARENLAVDLSAFLEAHQLAPDDVDLVIDLVSIREIQEPVALMMALTFLGSIPTVTSWRNLILTASAFPKSMAGIPSDAITRIPRADWHLWKALYARRSTLSRLPLYGDYAIQHPELIEGFDPRFMDVSATIRYTLSEEWLLVRGVGLKKEGGGQYRKLADALVSMPDYYGSAHCPGCTAVDDCAHGRLPAAAPKVWRRIGTAHHLTVVTEQLAGVTFP